VKKIVNIVLITAISFVITFFLNFGSNLITEDRGEIVLGPIITISSLQYRQLCFRNFERRPMSPITLSVPKNLNLSDITSSSPIIIAEAKGYTPTATERFITINGVAPKTEAVILFKNTPKSTVDVRVVDTGNFKISTRMSTDIKDPAMVAAKEAVIMAAIYTFIFFFALLYIFQKNEELRNDAENIKKQVDELQTGSEMLKENVIKAQTVIKRTNILMVKRLSDYQKENDFWRDTVRKVLGKSRGKAAEKLIEEVTKNLKTYATLEKRSVDFDIAHQVAEILTREDLKT